MENNTLQHVGVLGMKWGHRKAAPTSAIKKRFDSTKAEKKAANREFSKDYNTARANPLNGFTKKGNQKWDKAVESAEKANKADAAFKIAKIKRKTAIKSKTAELEKNTSIGEKILFNEATRKLAAKYIVDNNMTVADAKKKANASAMRNTAVILGVIGAVKVAGAVYNSPLILS